MEHRCLKCNKVIPPGEWCWQIICGHFFLEEELGFSRRVNAGYICDPCYEKIVEAEIPAIPYSD